jgi:hypothetical protein
VLHFLSGRDKGEIGFGILFLLAFGDDLLAFFDQALHSATGFGLRLGSKDLKGLLETLDLAFRLFQVFLKSFAQFWVVRSFGHFGQRFYELVFGMQQVLHLFDEHLFESGHLKSPRRVDAARAVVFRE